MKKTIFISILFVMLSLFAGIGHAQSYDLYNTSTITMALPPDTSRVTQYSAWVDNRLYQYGNLWLVTIGSGDDSLRAANTIRIVLQDSTAGAAAAAVTASTSYIGTMSTASTGTVALIDAVGEDSCLTKIQYVGPKRYSRIAIIRAGTHIETSTSVVSFGMKKEYGARP